MRILIVSVIVLLFVFPVAAQSAVNWEGLVTLNTTRAELRKLLGEPDYVYENADLFFMPEQKVSVHYASGRCNGLSPRWNVRRGIVASILVLPITPSKFDATTLRADFVRGSIQDDLSVDYRREDGVTPALLRTFPE